MKKIKQAKKKRVMLAHEYQEDQALRNTLI